MRLLLAVSMLVGSALPTHGLRGQARALATTYPLCNATATKLFTDNLSTASSGCTDATSYVWDGDADPTTAQRTALCNCTVSAFNVPKCHWTKLGTVDVNTSTHFKLVYDCASSSGKATPTVTEVELAATTLTPTPTTAAPTSAPAAPSSTTTTPAPSTAGTTSAPATTSPASASSKTAADYASCTEDQLAAFTTSLNTASSGCMGGTSYVWGGNTNPTPTQYAEICKCTAVNTFTIPECSVLKGPDSVTLSVHYNWVTATECATFAPSTSTTSSSNIGLIAGGAGGAVVIVVLLIIMVVCMRKRKSKSNRQQEQYQPPNAMNAMRSPAAYHPIAVTPPILKTSTNPRPSGLSDATHTTISTANGSVRASGTGSWGTGSHNRRTDGIYRWTDTGKWDDPAIMAVRIPHDAIFFGALLSRGGYGEVFRGTYRGETVAIKQLLPARRKDLEQIDSFLGEVKLMSSLEHERIVKFIGVAWNSLSDACMVVEFMENGDLRSVLNRWDHGDEQRPNGFDADKVRIALHVAHALTYLHSMQPIVVHRDLKSKNILLDANFDAKVTDFGISRERADSTMTAGVGSSLWMAPEVMLGERYSEKADIFSFGVVLSELDTHQLPYFHAKVAETGQKIPEAAILQQVMLGRLTVGFTDRADPDLVQLGHECVNLDPKARPSAAQVLHRVHQVMQGWHKAMDF